MDKYTINEVNIKENDAYPVFIITSFTFSILGKVITKVTDSNFSHASISIDPTLNDMYSFNFNPKSGINSGFVKENIETFKRFDSNSIIQVSCIWLRKSKFDKLNAILNDMVLNKEKYRYHAAGLISVLLNKENKDDYKMICSEFVAKLMSLLDINIFDKNLSSVTPSDFSDLPRTNAKVYLLYNGYIRDYNSNIVNSMINSLKKSSEYINEIGLLEAKEFPVDFDKDGNLIIQNYKKLNFEAEYSKSHKLLVLYESHGNIEGMKYELSKLWFMNNVLEKKIHSNIKPEEREKCIKVRARILNDFNKYLNFVLSKEPSFNFTEYYNDSPFSDVKIKISGTLISGIIDLIKQSL